MIIKWEPWIIHTKKFPVYKVLFRQYFHWEFNKINTKILKKLRCALGIFEKPSMSWLGDESTPFGSIVRAMLSYLLGLFCIINNLILKF
jgi:hypothetical protein